MTRASLIVLNFNGAGVVLPCVGSLVDAMGPDDELILVDNASVDGSVDEVAAAYPQVQIVRLTENTYIFGLNEGLARAKGTYVAFLNNDMVVEPNFVDACLAHFEDDVFAVCPRIQQNGQEQGSRTAGFWHRGLIFYRPLPHSQTATDCFFAVGGQSFFDRERLEEIGSIDPLLWPMYHEDIELSYRAWKRGWRIRYAPDTTVDHVGGHTSKRVFTPTQLRSFVRQNEYLTVWKDVTDSRLLIGHLAWLPFRVLAAAVKSDWATLIGLGRALRRLPDVRAARRRAQEHFERRDAEVLALVGGIR